MFQRTDVQPHTWVIRVLLMPLHRRFTARNAFIVVTFFLVTVLLVHLKYVISGEDASAATAADLDADLLPKLGQPFHDSASTHQEDDKKLQVNTGIKTRRTAVVVASQASENATWLDEYFPQWEKNIYRVDDPHAPLTVPKNKGRESMVYLTFVLSLPSL